MRKRRLLWLIPLAFIIVNIVLISKDDGEKVKRLHYIKQWETVESKDLKETLTSEGVFDYAHEYDVYMDDETGSFNEFSVAVGDQVESGDPLFSYKVREYFNRKLELESDIQKIDQEIAAVQAAIQRMQGVIINQSTAQILYPDGSEAGTIPSDTSVAESNKEQYMIEKEKELGQLEAEKTSIEAQLNDLVSGKDTIVVGSSYDGKVTQVSQTLENPVVTIASNELHITGELSENERMKVEEGMNVDIELTDGKEDKTLAGVVSFVSDQVEDLSLENESAYDMHITLEDEEDQENILHGYHADVTITLAEVADAAVLTEKAFPTEKQDYVWLMRPSGYLKKQAVDTGLIEGNNVQVTSGLEKHDLVLLNADKNMHETEFITKFKPSKASWKAIWQEGPRKRSIFIGLLGR